MRQIDENAVAIALGMAVRHLNTPLRDPVTEATALGWLRDGDWSDDQEPLARALMEETTEFGFARMVLEGAVTYGQLSERASELLSPADPKRSWIGEMADVRLA